jgi:uncharacterized phage protein (TIGR02216 family)
MAVGFGLLGLAPAAFWAMTPRELAAAVRGRLGPAPATPPNKDEMRALMQRFPDKE